MADLEKVTFERGAWSNEVERDLWEIGDMTDREVKIYRDAVIIGRFQLWDILENERRVGTLIWSVQKEPDGLTFVVNAGAVRGADASVLAAGTEAFVSMARRSGARSVLCWTERAGLMRRLEREFSARRKYVMEIEL